MKTAQAIEVRMWGSRVGAVAPGPVLDCYAFSYEPAWRRKVIELTPLTTPPGCRCGHFITGQGRRV